MRGIALMMIFIDHIPGNSFARFTLQAIGFNDAAEVFVFLAGLSAALAYGSAFDRSGFVEGSRKVFGRVAKIYVTHVVLFLIVAAMVVGAARVFGDPMYLDVISAGVFETEPLTALMRVVTLTFQPTYLDILPLYVVLLSAVPLLLMLAKVHLLLPLGASTILFAVAQIADVNLPNYPTVAAWYFNPAAWQLLFVLGFTLGCASRAGHTLPRLPIVTAGAVLVVVASALIAAPWRALPGLADAILVPASFVPTIDKTNLAPLRLLNVLAQAWLVAVLVPRNAAFLNSGVATLLSSAGKKSLEIFALGIVLSFAGMIALTELGHSLIFHVLVTALGISLMLGTAHFMERRDSVARARARAQATGAENIA